MSKRDRRKIRAISGFLVLVLIVVGSFVSANAASAKLNKKKATVTVGKTVKLKVKNTGKTVKWTSSNKKVATVKKSGKYGAVVKGKKAGKVTITAKMGKKKLKCKVTVKKKKGAANNKFDPPGPNIFYGLADDLDTVAIGKPVDLFEHVYLAGQDCRGLSNSMRKEYFKWTSSDSSVFSIDKYGIGTGKKTGVVKVQMKKKYSNGKWVPSQSITVKVRDVSNVSISFQTGLNMEWLEKNKGLVEIYDQYKSQVNYFNYISCTIRNDTDSDITMNRKLNTYTGGAGIVAAGGVIGYTSNITYDVDCDDVTGTYHFYTENRNQIKVPKHSTITIIYQNDKLLCSFGEKGKVGFLYTMNNEAIIATYFFKDNSWHYNA